MTTLKQKIAKIKKQAKEQGLKTTEGLILSKGKLKEMQRDERN